MRGYVRGDWFYFSSLFFLPSFLMGLFFLASPSELGRSRPYQGVRVRDPVKELLRRKRSLELQNTKNTPPAADVEAHNNQSSFTQGSFGSDAAAGSSAELAAAGDEGLLCAGWKTMSSVTNAAPQPAVMAWSPSDYNQQDPTAQTLAYPAAPALAADVYMQTLCPSYTMLTYTHTPLLTNFGIPVAPGQSSLSSVEFPDSGLAYPLWAQPLTTISTLPNPGVQFPPGSASPLIHMPLSLPLTSVIPQLDAQDVNPQPQIVDLPHHSEDQLDPEPQEQSLSEETEEESESSNLLDKLLEDQKGHDEEEDKDSYTNSLFLPNI
nr:POU domain class 2-associating factor 1 isoform X1 [Nothobranchius furzeri]